MAKNPPSFLTLSILFLLPTVFSSNNNSPNPPPPSSSIQICKSTPSPSFCTALLPATSTSTSTSTANIRDYGLFSLRKSLISARKFLSLIQTYLRRSKSLTITAIRALQDCEFLAQCNVDNLITSARILNQTTQTLPDLKADDVQTLLSAILTNAQTCTDGIQTTASTWSIRKTVISPLANDTRLFTLSLDLVNRGWVKPKKKKHVSVASFKRKQLKLGNGRFNLRMSEKNLRVFRKATSRRLLQTGGDDSQIDVSDIVTVSQDGTGNFSTINDALALAPNNTNGSTGYFLIYIKAGLYQEYVSVPKNKVFLMMIGDGINQTIITGNRSVVDGWTTFNSATFAVVAPNFIAADITFRNTAGPAKHQAVAVRNGADLSVFYQCSFEAYQDTLYAHSLRQFYSECDVYGTVDFIFGNAAAVFQNCNLYPRLPMSGQFNAITAQGRTDPNQNTGTSFQNCNVKAAADLAAANVTVQTFLGRPWKQYSRTVFMQSFMDSLVDNSGWSVWSGDFALNTSYYAEFNNTGPGANTIARVTWPGFHVINQTDASNFTVSAFLLGDMWIPTTGVPYRGGLV